MDKARVLVICVHNSARSQMAEAFFKKYGADTIYVMSAGLDPGRLNPIAVEVMREIGIDISGNETKSVFDLYKQNLAFDYVITVCDEKTAESCPLFPGKCKRLHWPFDDPGSFYGTKEDILEKTRKTRDEIERKVKGFLADLS